MMLVMMTMIIIRAIIGMRMVMVVYGRGELVDSPTVALL